MWREHLYFSGSRKDGGPPPVYAARGLGLVKATYFRERVALAARDRAQLQELRLLDMHIEVKQDRPWFGDAPARW